MVSGHASGTHGAGFFWMNARMPSAASSLVRRRSNVATRSSSESGCVSTAKSRRLHSRKRVRRALQDICDGRLHLRVELSRWRDLV